MQIFLNTLSQRNKTMNAYRKKYNRQTINENSSRAHTHTRRQTHIHTYTYVYIDYIMLTYQATLTSQHSMTSCSKSLITILPHFDFRFPNCFLSTRDAYINFYHIVRCTYMVGTWLCLIPIDECFFWKYFYYYKCLHCSTMW